MLENLGSMVRVEGRMIPAVSIQVDGVPGYIDGVWYGVYFEILWEDAALWIVEQGTDQNHKDRITLKEYRNWGTGIGVPIEGPTILLQSWRDFVGLYDEKRLTF